jgi:hypothetical protein
VGLIEETGEEKRRERRQIIDELWHICEEHGVRKC